MGWSRSITIVYGAVLTPKEIERLEITEDFYGKMMPGTKYEVQQFANEEENYGGTDDNGNRLDAPIYIIMDYCSVDIHKYYDPHIKVEMPEISSHLVNRFKDYLESIGIPRLRYGTYVAVSKG